MRIRASVTDFLRNFSDYINRVSYRNERFLLMRGGKPVAEVSPVAPARRLGELPELLASLPRLSEEDAQALARDLERARSEMDEGGLRDPWPS
jgi:antitoxin (DNA-binding transcriptional repressor) of toxin-antitoxin stability system